MGKDIDRCTGQIRDLYDPPRVNPDIPYEIEDFIVPSTIKPQVGHIPSTIFVAARTIGPYSSISTVSRVDVGPLEACVGYLLRLKGLGVRTWDERPLPDTHSQHVTDALCEHVLEGQV